MTFRVCWKCINSAAQELQVNFYFRHGTLEMSTNCEYIFDMILIMATTDFNMIYLLLNVIFLCAPVD